MGTLLLAGPGSAIPSAASPPPALPVAVVGAGTSSFSYACGGLTFSNFTAAGGGSSVKDVDFYFTVTGGIGGIGLPVGGDRATITERACKTALDVTGANSCTGGLVTSSALLTESQRGMRIGLGL